MFAQNVNNRPRIIGLTGGIGSGKTEVSKYLTSKGILVIDSDEIVKKLWIEDTNLHHNIKKHFQIDVQDKDFKQQLAKIIFNDEEKRVLLNDLIHPSVFLTIDEMIEKNQDKPYIFIDMPLLFEVGYDRYCDYIVVVYAPKDVILARIMKRDQLSMEEALLKMDAQLSLDLKVEKGHYVIHNDHTLSHLQKQVDALLKEVKDAYEIISN